MRQREGWWEENEGKRERRGGKEEKWIKEGKTDGNESDEKRKEERGENAIKEKARRRRSGNNILSLLIYYLSISLVHLSHHDFGLLYVDMLVSFSLLSF